MLVTKAEEMLNITFEQSDSNEQKLTKAYRRQKRSPILCNYQINPIKESPFYLEIFIFSL